MRAARPPYVVAGDRHPVASDPGSGTGGASWTTSEASVRHRSDRRRPGRAGRGLPPRRRGSTFVILDANARVGDAWRPRWDSLRLFTPARYDGLPGMPFPAPARVPTKDQMADYLEAYARWFDLPVRTGVEVDARPRARAASGFVVEAGDEVFEAAQVVVASGAFVTRRSRVRGRPRSGDPSTALERVPRPGAARDGPVLVVGAADSGAEVALEIAVPAAIGPGLRGGTRPAAVRLEGREDGGSPGSGSPPTTC